MVPDRYSVPELLAAAIALGTLLLAWCNAIARRARVSPPWMLFREFISKLCMLLVSLTALAYAIYSPGRHCSRFGGRVRSSSVFLGRPRIDDLHASELPIRLSWPLYLERTSALACLPRSQIYNYPPRPLRSLSALHL